ncbi:MAG: single-stranded DNA-binding protein [Oscillospiraceae bacterium]|jgi:single-strand DNA-binding protein|nr:single-stranded DNA-binding protein [Oscillospiraceae bacterium]
MNIITLMGRMTRDPELRTTQSGTSVTSFTLAVDRQYAPKEGERQTDFIDIVAWGKTAEFVSRWFVKGQMTAVTGRLQIRDWTDKDGNKRRSAEVVAENVFFTGDRRDKDVSGTGYSEYGSGGGFRKPAAPSSPAAGHSPQFDVPDGGFAEYEDDEELPF